MILERASWTEEENPSIEHTEVGLVNCNCWCNWCPITMLLLLLLLLEEVVKPSVELTELVELSVERLDTVLNPTTIESACSKGRREFRISASSLAL